MNVDLIPCIARGLMLLSHPRQERPDIRPFIIETNTSHKRSITSYITPLDVAGRELPRRQASADRRHALQLGSLGWRRLLYHAHLLGAHMGKGKVRVKQGVR